MTTIHATAENTASPATNRVPNVFAAITGAWASLRRHHIERRTIVRLSRMEPRLIRDMGFEPDAIYAALEGSWDELDPGRFTTRR